MDPNFITLTIAIATMVLRASPRVPKRVSKSRNFEKIGKKTISNNSQTGLPPNLLALGKKNYPHTRKVTCSLLSKVEGRGKKKR